MLKINHPDYTKIQKEMVKSAVKAKEEVASLHKEYKSDRATSAFALLAVTACVGVILIDVIIDFMAGWLLMSAVVAIFLSMALFAATGEPWLFPFDSQYRNITAALDKIIDSKDFLEAATVFDTARGDGETSWTSCYWEYDEMERLCFFSTDVLDMYRLQSVEILDFNTYLSDFHESSKTLTIHYCEEDGKVQEMYLRVQEEENAKIQDSTLSYKDGGLVLNKAYKR